MSKFKVRSTVLGLVALSLIGVGILSPVQATTNFQDVSSSHIYATQIQYMKDHGISYGFNNGTEYRPESPITRKEIITLLIKAKYPMEEINNCISANGYTGKNIFNDVPSTHQFAPAICMAKVKNIAVGYTGGNFGPDDATTAHAGIKVIMRTLVHDLPIDINAPLEEYTKYLWDRGFYPPTINRADESTVGMERGDVAYTIFNSVESLPNNNSIECEGLGANTKCYLKYDSEGTYRSVLINDCTSSSKELVACIYPHNIFLGRRVDQVQYLLVQNTEACNCSFSVDVYSFNMQTQQISLEKRNFTDGGLLFWIDLADPNVTSTCVDLTIETLFQCIDRSELQGMSQNMIDENTEKIIDIYRNAILYGISF
jgi:hypothetical protein